MPASLDRCVSHVMDQGHSESSAYAICRSSMGLMSDGSEDDKDIDMPEEQMRSRVTIALQFQNGPALVKEIVACGPMGKFVNGEQRGVMDRKRLAALADKFRKYRRQVPIFMEAEHPESNDEAVPVGWVEGLRMDGDKLMARVKLHGPGAVAVGGDLVRGASIYTVNAKDYDGSAIGEVLKHLLLTNEPYYKDLNIAATHKGGEAVACVFTALKGEADMAKDEKDQEIARLKDENAALKAMTPDETAAAKLKEYEVLMAEKTRENLELVAANENLKNDVERFRNNPEMSKQLAMQARQLKAHQIRRLVKDGVQEGRFSRAMVGDPKTGYDHPSDEGVLVWFKDSIFKDSLDRLDFALATFPRVRMERTFPHGEGAQDTEVTMTEQDKAYLKSIGKDPEKVMAAMKSKGAGEYAAATASAKE